MSKKRLFYDEKGANTEIWFPLEYWKDLAYDECRDIILLEAAIDPNGEPFCNYYGDFGPDCGKYRCEEYSPCNDINGKCRYLSKSIKRTDKEFLLKFEETHREDDLIYGNVKVVEYFEPKLNNTLTQLNNIKL
jgi:hypothetical protein